MADPLTKGLTREKVEKASKGMCFRLRTSHYGGNSILQTGDPRARFKEKNKVVTDGSTLSMNSIHSHNEENFQKRG